MKYIKSYEDNISDKPSYYWKTTLKRPNFIISLRKIGVPEDVIKNYDQKFIDDDFDVFIVKHYNEKTDEYEWYYSQDTGYRGPSYKNMGTIEVEEHEIDSYKYNL